MLYTVACRMLMLWPVLVAQSKTHKAISAGTCSASKKNWRILSLPFAGGLEFRNLSKQGLVLFSACIQFAVSKYIDWPTKTVGFIYIDTHIFKFERY